MIEVSLKAIVNGVVLMYLGSQPVYIGRGESFGGVTVVDVGVDYISLGDGRVIQMFTSHSPPPKDGAEVKPKSAQYPVYEYFVSPELKEVLRPGQKLDDTKPYRGLTINQNHRWNINLCGSRRKDVKSLNECAKRLDDHDKKRYQGMKKK